MTGPELYYKTVELNKTVSKALSSGRWSDPGSCRSGQMVPLGCWTGRFWLPEST